jgi:hypothetical protein
MTEETTETGARRRDPETTQASADTRVEYRPPAGRPVRASLLLAGGLTAGVLTLISFFYTAQWYRWGSDHRLLLALAEEMAVDHRAGAPLEIEGGDPATVLAGLGWEAAGADRRWRPRTGETLTGGRRTSIRDQATVALRYRQARGSISTRYAGELTPALARAIPDHGAGAPPARHLIRGVDVRIWREGLRLYGEALEPGAGRTR